MGSNAFSYIESLRHVIIGAKGDPSQMRGLPDDVNFFGGSYLEDILVYPDGTNNAEFAKYGFTYYGDMHTEPTLTIKSADEE